MDNRIPPFRPDVVGVQSAPRPTPTPVRVNFGEVLARGAQSLVAGAEAAMNVLPGGPIVAAALRGGGGGFVSGGPMHTMSGGGPGGSASPEGPAPSGLGGTATGGSPGGADGGIEGSLQQAQEMNLYYLQIQQQVDAQNRTFTTLSNVMKAEHDTVKNAIGNIR